MWIREAFRDNAQFQIWFFSVLSTLAGSVCAYLLWLDFDTPFYLLGFAHLIVLLPAMVLTQQRIVGVLAVSVLCIMFPMWGTILGLFTAGAAAPIMCSVAWGLIVMWSLRRPSAFAIILGIGLVSNIVMHISLPLGSGQYTNDPDLQFVSSIACWYMLMLGAMPWIMLFKPTPLAPKFSGTNICPNCGYSLFGLELDALCPECGQSR